MDRLAPLVVFLSQPTGSMDGLYKVELIREGSWAYPGIGKFEVTKEKIQQLDRNFALGVNHYMVPGTWEHAKVKDDPSKTVSWLRKTEVGTNQGRACLWGYVSIDDPDFKKLVDNGQVKFISAEIDFDYLPSELTDGIRRGVGPVLVGFAFTNQPYVKRMASIKPAGKVMAVNLSDGAAARMKGFKAQFSEVEPAEAPHDLNEPGTPDGGDLSTQEADVELSMPLTPPNEVPHRSVKQIFDLLAQNKFEDVTHLGSRPFDSEDDEGFDVHGAAHYFGHKSKVDPGDDPGEHEISAIGQIGKHLSMLGHLKFNLKDGKAAVTISKVNPKLKGMGFGRGLYDAAIAYASQHGAKEFHPDLVVTKDAQRIWDKLTTQYPPAAKLEDGRPDTSLMRGAIHAYGFRSSGPGIKIVPTSPLSNKPAPRQYRFKLSEGDDGSADVELSGIGDFFKSMISREPDKDEERIGSEDTEYPSKEDVETHGHGFGDEPHKIGPEDTETKGKFQVQPSRVMSSDPGIAPDVELTNSNGVHSPAPMTNVSVEPRPKVELSGKDNPLVDNDQFNAKHERNHGKFAKKGTGHKGKELPETGNYAGIMKDGAEAGENLKRRMRLGFYQQTRTVDPNNPLVTPGDVAALRARGFVDYDTGEVDGSGNPELLLEPVIKPGEGYFAPSGELYATKEGIQNAATHVTKQQFEDLWALLWHTAGRYNSKFKQHLRSEGVHNPTLGDDFIEKNPGVGLAELQKGIGEVLQNPTPRTVRSTKNSWPVSEITEGPYFGMPVQDPNVTNEQMGKHAVQQRLIALFVEFLGSEELEHIMARALDFGHFVKGSYTPLDVMAAYFEGNLPDVKSAAKPEPTPPFETAPAVDALQADKPWSPTYAQITPEMVGPMISSAMKGDSNAIRQTTTVVNSKPELLGPNLPKATVMESVGGKFAEQDSVNQGVPAPYTWVGLSNVAALLKAPMEIPDAEQFVAEVFPLGHSGPPLSNEVPGEIVGSDALKAALQSLASQELRVSSASGRLVPAAPVIMTKTEASEANSSVNKGVLTTIMALDTNLDYKDLSVVVTFPQPDVYGLFNPLESTLYLYGANGGLPTTAHEMGHYLDRKWGDELNPGTHPALAADEHLFYGGLASMGDAVENGWVKEGTPPEKLEWAKAYVSFVRGIQDKADASSAYYLSPWEVFARFVGQFVYRMSALAATHAGGELGPLEAEGWLTPRKVPEMALDDFDTRRGVVATDDIKFIKLLQWRAALDAKFARPDAAV